MPYETGKVSKTRTVFEMTRCFRAWVLAAQTELADDGAIALDIVVLQIAQQAAAGADQFQEAQARGMVFFCAS